MKQSLSIEARVAIAADQSIRAIVYHGLWFATASAEHRKKFWNGLAEHWDALRFYQAGQLYALVLTLSCLFERRRDTVNLRRLSVELDGLELRRIEAAEPTAKKIEKLRHHLFAHRSGRLDREGIYDLAQISSDEMKLLAQEAFEISASFCLHLKMPTPPEPTNAIGAGFDMLEALTRDAKTNSPFA